MTAIATTSFRLFNAKNFLSDLTERSYYAFIGRPQSWSNENSPDTLYDNNRSNYFDAWQDILALKRLNATDAVHAIPRYNWTSGLVYAGYDDAVSPANPIYDGVVGSLTARTSLYESKFYVLTDEFNIYKCLWNAGNVASTVKPTGTGNDPITTGDGYIWKYMGSISVPDATKFLNDDFIPVRNNNTANPSNDGSVHTIKVKVGGSGYTSAPLTITGDGTGLTATANISGGIITSITVNTKGSGYTWCNISVGGDGVGATVQAQITPNGGHGYDTIAELGALYVITTIQFQYDESGYFPVTNDFRRVGIVVNPFIYGTSTIATAARLNATKKVSFTSATGTFNLDEVITNATTGKGRVVTYDSVSVPKSIGYIVTPSEGNVTPFAISDVIQGQISGANATLTAVANPDVEPYTGEFIYIENRRAVSRASDQIETISMVIQF